VEGLSRGNYERQQKRGGTSYRIRETSLTQGRVNGEGNRHTITKAEARGKKTGKFINA